MLNEILADTNLPLVSSVGTAVFIALLVLAWVKVSPASRGNGWRAQKPSRHDFPHLHVVDGVLITHAHRGGDKAHSHETITVSMKHYADLHRRASQGSSSER